MLRKMIVGTVSIAGLVALSVCAEETLRVSLPNLPPLAEITSDGQRGFIYEIYLAVAKEMGVTLDLRVAPLARLILELKQGEVDSTFIMENPNVAEWSYPLASVNVNLLSMVFVSRADAPIRALQDLTGKIVGHPRGGGLLAKLIDLSVVREYELTTYTQGIQMLQAKRLDAVFGTEMPIYHSIKQVGIPLDQFAPPFVAATTPAWFYFSKKSPNQALRERLQAAVETLSNDGTFARIEEQFRQCFMEGNDCAAITY